MEHSSSSKMERHQEQADLVVDGFKGLLSKYDPYSDSLNDRRRTRVHREKAHISRPEFEKVLFNRLHSNLVPLLGQQIANLSRSLNPTHFQNYLVLTFQLILEVQSKLHQTLNQIESAIETICAHRTTIRSRRVNDQNLQHFKLFRLDGLCRDYTEGLMPEIVDFFKESRRLINLLKIPKKVTESRKDLKSARQCIIDRTSSIMVRINTHIEWYNGPEFDLVQLGWPKETHRIDDSLGELLSLINQAKYNSSVTQAARLLVPLFKLSRLFFNRISKRGMNQKPLPLFTSLRTDQLVLLEGLPGRVASYLTHLLEYLRGSVIPSHHVNEVAKCIEEEFESPLFMISLHFLPLIPDTDGFPTQNYFRTWLVTWCNLLSLAIQHLEGRQPTTTNLYDVVVLPTVSSLRS
ncbi:hypothetical protein MJO28_000516 [Puccinia striiformis f. sp. tritici]|uniref:Uncharacterized protein n=1 Tax=Puccinia striiformis f. sp. tritici TaxID=168172 RepID=A0ACC0EY50_9BASI|nr:hypothetical protein Pst134EB_001923 [Puccinia striiformis f. sp. tritici]KAI7962422.1 hypothetical protein MJO28_000516 [Puccinia striiformis f. sp. tritici]